MKLSNITLQNSKFSMQKENETFSVTRKVFKINQNTNEYDKTKRTFFVTDLSTLIDEAVADTKENQFSKENDFFFYGSGYQSWGFGGETEPGKYERKYIPIIPQFKKYITMPGDISFEENKLHGRKLQGHFVIYFRWNNVYLVVASTGNSPDSISKNNFSSLPPVEFSITRKKRILCCSVDAVGKKWNVNETVAELSIFAVHNFFELKDIIKLLYSSEASENDKRFSSYKKLSMFKNKFFACGWESWYNHYNDINEKLISEDLEALGNTDNIIKTYALPKTNNVVFQVDDGWEKAAGVWDCNEERFPCGMKNLADSISKKGYVPGLWIAPFIIDYRSEFCKNHIDWILRDKNGNPVEAGFNPLWGAGSGNDKPGLPYSFYCLDLSIPKVAQYLDILIDHIVNGWGFRYLKLDFLYAGMLEGKLTNGGASYEWYEKAISILTSRKANDKGEDIFYLGCGMPFELSFNHLPLSRIGPDTKESWDISYMKALRFSGRTSAHKNLQSTLGHAFWNEGIYLNDPDVVFLRNKNISLNEDEKKLIALVNFLFAGQLMHSDDPTLFDKKTDGPLTKEIETLFNTYENEEFGIENITCNTYFIFSKSGKYSGAINLSKKNITVKNKAFEKDLLVKKHSIIIVENKRR